MQGDSLRERKQRRQRRAIEEVAIQLFEERGFEATGVAAIAEAAEVSPRTVYRYFGSKEEIVLAASEEFIAAIRSFIIDRPPAESCFEALRNALFEMTDYLEEHKERIARGLAIINSSAALQRRLALHRVEWVEELVHDLGKRPGPRVDQFDRRVVVGAWSAAFDAAFRRWSDGSEDEPLCEVLRRAFAVLDQQARKQAVTTST